MFPRLRDAHLLAACVVKRTLQKVFFTVHYFISFTRRLRLRIIDGPCAIVDAPFGFSVSGPCVRSSSLWFKLTCDRHFPHFPAFVFFRPCITTTVAFHSTAPDFCFRAPIRLLMPAWFLSVNFFIIRFRLFFLFSMLDWSFQRPADIRLRFRYNLNFVLYFSFDTTLPPRSMENDLIAWFKSCPFVFKLFLFCFFFLCMCCALGFAFVFWALGIDGMDLFFDIWDFIHMGWYQIRLAYCLDISDLAVKPCFWHWIIFFHIPVLLLLSLLLLLKLTDVIIKKLLWLIQPYWILNSIDLTFWALYHRTAQHRSWRIAAH